MTLIRNLMNDRWAAASIFVIAITLLAGAFAPWIAPHDPFAVNMKLRFAPVSWQYWLGNDHLGRCVLSRILYGIRPSVLWVLATLAVSVLIGSAIGFVAGYFKGKTDAVLMRICDVMLSFPGYVMTLAIVGMLGPGLEHILLAFLVMKWAWFARVIRTSVMQYSEADYVRFSKAIGIRSRSILLSHVFPRVLPDIAVISSGSICSMILQVSGLSFLGLGIQAPHAEWGMMMNEAREVMFSRPEFMLAPGLAIVIVVSAFNFLADSLQVALDPKLMTRSIRRRSKEVKRTSYEYIRG
ncbi:staphylopine uptake ABC transporter permease subunit CntC [Paenibacillus sp. PL91]|uniref:staphylopine uptake ABC transporter permease subunit CntC n=1 Tax=Paenibacillus sp. PL91 TaxID=2729538 RepID=UPI00145D6EEA|nr:nickel/cobalt ABC transporter permease [Paenibacillus sp. PL91]MBC9204025.1 ABC transporter permease subunit [Paenibacillus sp. PL91]